MIVETKRIIPVIHAKLFRTSSTEATVAVVWLASSSCLEMCNDDDAPMMDPKDAEASLVDIMSPTILPTIITAKIKLSGLAKV